jgi:hypothetical protein
MAPTVQLSPLVSAIGSGAKAGPYRINCNGQWKPKSEGFGHTCMTLNMKNESILGMGTNDTDICQ